MTTPVRKRLVFYCHGYDPDADSRYRRLFVTGFSQLARRFKIARRIGPVVKDDAVPAVRWAVNAGTAAWQTETRYEVLRWDDIVQRDFARGWHRRLPLMFGTMAEALRGAVVQRLFRVYWPFALFVVYPWAALLAIVGAALAIGYAAARLVALALPLPGLATALVTLGIAGAVLHGFGARIRKAYVYHLLDGWICSWQQAAGRRADIDARLDRFAQHVVDTVRAAEADEVLIVGHSTGSILAVELAARALARDPEIGRRGVPVALLTIGSCLPVVGMVRTAARLRRDVARLVTAADLLWVEYQAPQDALNAFGFEPVRDLKLDLGGAEAVNPRIRSARFRDTLLPSTYRKMQWNFFRVHFHFLMANEIPGEYDYLMIACGPVSLADRIADPDAALYATYGAVAVPAEREEADPARHDVPA